MFARSLAVSTLFALSALAAPTGSSGSCNTGNVQCCNSLEHSSSAAGSGILGLLGINLQDVTGMIGLQCSPLSVIGLGGGSACSQQPVCCQNNNVGGLISIGCIPIQL